MKSMIACKILLRLALYAFVAVSSRRINEAELGRSVDASTPRTAAMASIQPSTRYTYPLRLQMREVTHLRALAAVWRFSCPIYGPSIKEFKWKATFNQDNMHVKVTSIQNIDKIDKLIIDGADFSTNYHHSFCVTIGDQHCHYTFRGHTEGTVYTDGIAMSMTLFSALDWDNPLVEELCLTMDRALPGTCPVGEGTSCRIDRIDVRKLR